MIDIITQDDIEFEFNRWHENNFTYQIITEYWTRYRLEYKLKANSRLRKNLNIISNYMKNTTVKNKCYLMTNYEIERWNFNDNRNVIFEHEEVYNSFFQSYKDLLFKSRNNYLIAELIYISSETYSITQLTRIIKNQQDFDRWIELVENFKCNHNPLKKPIRVKPKCYHL